jgi:hypothetical protein
LPAATLLLPYFEIDLHAPDGETTVFTVTNVSQLPQIARATVWTDRAYPLLHFYVYLTGYDVQTINLYDILANGIIAPPDGTTSETEPGERSLEENPLLDVRACDSLAVTIPSSVLSKVGDALTTGLVSGCGPNRVGNLQPDKHARGYVTIDVVKSCEASPAGFAASDYFSSELLFDNVLTGDYQQVDAGENYAQGGTLVHIRAIPEGGVAGEKTTSFASTFYSRQLSGGTADRRQPLPSTYVARWISGGQGSLNTDFKIWRDGITPINAGCNVAPNATSISTEFVRFDEQENPVTLTCNIGICEPFTFALPSASQVAAADTTIFPPNPGGDLAGWMYLNLNNQSPLDGMDATQAWVIVSMFAEGRFSADFDAAALGNGCSPAAPMTIEDGTPPVIGPAANDNGGS